MKPRSNKTLQFADLSKYKAEIYGISILWIMLFHAFILHLDYTFGTKFLKPLNALIGLGNVGVEVFLFCSGVFLYFSYHNNKNVFTFYKKRVERLFLPVVIITGLYWVYRYLIVKHNFWLFLSKFTMLDFWVTGDQQIWFVACILVCYLIYPLVYSYLFECKFLNTTLRLCILLLLTTLLTLTVYFVFPDFYSKTEIALSRFPVFFIGCYAGRLVYDKKTLPGYFNIVFLIVSILGTFMLLFVNIHAPYYRWAFIILGIPLTFVFMWLLNILKCKSLNKFFAFLGAISLNLYVSHIMLIRVYKLTPFAQHKHILHYLLLLVLSVALAYVAELLINLITKKRGKQ